MAKAKMNQPNYTNCLTFQDMDEDLGLFDDIPFKYVRKYSNDEDIEVEIIDLECDRGGWCKTLFKFELESYICKDSMKCFEVVLEYNNSSIIANIMMENELCKRCNKQFTTYCSSYYGSDVCCECEEDSDSD